MVGRALDRMVRLKAAPAAVAVGPSVERGGHRGGGCCARRCCCWTRRCCCCPRRCCCCCCFCRYCCRRCCWCRAGAYRSQGPIAPRGWPRRHKMLAPLRLQQRKRCWKRLSRWRKRALDRRGGWEGCGRGGLSHSLLGALRPFHIVLLLARRRRPFHLVLLLARGRITRGGAGAGRRGRCGHRSAA